MINWSDKIVVEFSLKQQAFHRETVKDMIEHNVTNIFLKRNTDYLPIGFFDTHEDADKFIKAVYDTIKKSETDLEQDAAIDFINNFHP